MSGLTRDQLVEQLLDERRRRLQQKLGAETGAISGELSHAEVFVRGSRASQISTGQSVETALLGDQPAEALGLGTSNFGSRYADSLLSGGMWTRDLDWHEDPEHIRESGEFTFAGASPCSARASSSSATGAAVRSGSVGAAARRGGSPQRSGSARGGLGRAPPEGARARPRSAPPVRARALGRDRALSTPMTPPPGTRSQEVRPDFRARIQEWQLRHQALQNKQERARREKESQELHECTFKPSLNAKSEFYARRTRGCYMEPLVERLHHEADKRAVLRQKAKELVEADSMCSYTFRPQINRHRASSSSAVEAANTKPIHMRAEELARQKQENAKQAQAAEDIRSQCSFQPRISEKSERLVQKKRDEIYKSVAQGNTGCLKLLGPVEERLYAEAQALEQRRATRVDSVSEPSIAAPILDEESRRICKASVYFQGAQQDFLTRQQTFELAKNRRMQVRAQRSDAKCPFRPGISDRSRQLCENNIDFVGETPEERINRLAVKDAERRDQLRGALDKLHYRECTFKPQVNANSQMLASRLEEDLGAMSDGGSVHERLYRSAQQQQYRSRFLDDPKAEECTFRPQLESNHRYAHVKSHYTQGDGGTKIMDSIRDELEQREEHLQERRREKNEQEHAHCTFAPDTRRPYEEPSRPVAVSGLGRFFELRGLAQRQQREQQERELKAFHPEALGSRTLGVTIPEPFKLSSGCSSAKAHRESMQDPEECTFMPRTLESENRALIRQIVGSAGH